LDKQKGENHVHTKRKEVYLFGHSGKRVYPERVQMLGDRIQFKTKEILLGI